jgi:hypothetical protein
MTSLIKLGIRSSRQSSGELWAPHERQVCVGVIDLNIEGTDAVGEGAGVVGVRSSGSCGIRSSKERLLRLLESLRAKTLCKGIGPVPRSGIVFLRLS